MKITSVIISAILGICQTASALTLDDAIYSGSGGDVKEIVTFNEIPFADASLTFTVDAAALTAAADKYNGQSVVLGYATAEIVALDPVQPYYTFAFFASYDDNDSVRFNVTYAKGDTPSAPTDGGNVFPVDTISAQDSLAFTLYGLLPVSIRLEYKWNGAVLPNSTFSSYLCGWKNVTAEDFDGIVFSSLHLNTEFVNSYYIFDQAATDAEANKITLAAADAAPPIIPEPATATLSLLALAALAARRRRK